MTTAMKIQFPQTGDAEKYINLSKIGEGTFGVVFKAQDATKLGSPFVALKSIKMEPRNGLVPISAIREIRILEKLKHDNVIKMLEVCKTKAHPQNNNQSAHFMVLEFCDHDLAGLIANPKLELGLGEIKHIMKQLLNGLFFIHSCNLIHRDLKPANILMTKVGVLKLADFGITRPYNVKTAPNRYTGLVYSLWYRSPEVLLGDQNYGPAMDIWAAGCILAELFTRRLILQSHTEQMQITAITQLCGPITLRVWPEVVKLQFYHYLRIELPKLTLKQGLFQFMRDRTAIDLFNRLIVLDPSKRLDADTALDHQFFWTDPMPFNLGKQLSKFQGSMLESRHLLTANQPVQGGPIRRVPSRNMFRRVLPYGVPPLARRRPQNLSSLLDDGGYQDRIY